MSAATFTNPKCARCGQLVARGYGDPSHALALAILRGGICSGCAHRSGFSGHEYPAGREKDADAALDAMGRPRGEFKRVLDSRRRTRLKARYKVDAARYIDAKRRLEATAREYVRLGGVL